MDLFTSTPLRRTVSAVACTLVFSSACLLGAVAPAMADTLPTDAAKRAWNQTVNARLNENIRDMSRVPAGIRAEAVVVIAAHFDAAGVFDGTTLVRSSGSRALDVEALRAAGQVRYPALPTSMQGRPQTIATRVFFGNRQSAATTRSIARVTREVPGSYARRIELAALPRG